TVIESLAEGLLVQDRQGAVVDCNTAARTLLGLETEVRSQTSEVSKDSGSPSSRTADLCPLTSAVLWLREDGSPLPPDEHPVRRVLRTGTPVPNVVLGIAHSSGEIRNPKHEIRNEVESRSDLGFPRSDFPPGRVRWVLINSLPLAPRPGFTPAGVVTTLVDVTDHIHAQQMLRA